MQRTCLTVLTWTAPTPHQALEGILVRQFLEHLSHKCVNVAAVVADGDLGNYEALLLSLYPSCKLHR